MARKHAARASKRSGKPAVPKTGAVWHRSAEQATLDAKPRYNGFACGYGAHGDVKYNRAREARSWKKQLDHEGASRGPFPLLGALPNRIMESLRIRALGGEGSTIMRAVHRRTSSRSCRVG